MSSQSETLTLTAEQAAAIAELDEAIVSVAEAFDDFTAAANHCDELAVPQPILLERALKLQQTIQAKMLP